MRGMQNRSLNHVDLLLAVAPQQVDAVRLVHVAVQARNGQRSQPRHVLLHRVDLYAQSPNINDPVISEIIIFSMSQRRRNELPRYARITSKSTS